MPDIKEKPVMGKPKAKNQSILAPKQAAHMLAQKYRRQLDQRVAGEENETEYATDSAERTMEQTLTGLTDELGRAVPSSRSDRIKERPSGKWTPEASHTEQPTTPGQQLAIKERTASYEQRNIPKERPISATAQKNVPKERATMEAMRQAHIKGHEVFPEPYRPTPQQNHTYHSSKQAGRAPSPSDLNNRRRGVHAAKDTFVQSTRRQAAQNVPMPRIDPARPCQPKAYRTGAIKERSNATASTIKTRFNTKAAAKRVGSATSPKVRPHTTQATLKRAANQTRKQAQRQFTQRMVTQAKKTEKTTVTLIKRAAIAITKAAAALIASLGGLVGGGILLVVLVVIVVIAAVANSPFGIFFAAERNAPDTVSVAEAVATVNIAYNAKLEQLQSGSYDSIVIHGQAPDWVDVLAVFAAKIAGTDEGGMDVATLDAARVNMLTAVFWDMTIITTEVEAIYHPGDPGWTEYILHITINAKTADDMRTAYSFTQYQNTALDELLADRAALSSLAGSLTITNTDVSDVLDALPTTLSPERREAVRVALTLVGKVNYFWGGKSHAIGWDSRWGTLQRVWADGNSTTGTYRPYGLDCSGYVDWIFNNSMNYIIGHGGGVRMQHRHSTDIPQSNAQPGDLAFYPDDSHIGIVVGQNAAGKLLVAHCSSGQNNVVVTEFAASGFTVVGRPDAFD